MSDGDVENEGMQLLAQCTASRAMLRCDAEGLLELRSEEPPSDRSEILYRIIPRRNERATS